MRYILLLLLSFPILLQAQQLPDRTVFAENSFLWNPAMTAVWDYWELGASYRQQWLGFEDAPTTAALNIQYPFLDYNGSLGGYFVHDVVKPLKYSTFALTYAYKIKLGIKKYDQLSIGVMANLSQYLLDGLDVVVNDEDDVLIPAGESSKFSFNAGVGLFYTTYAKDDFDENMFFAGLAANQIVPNKLVFDEFGGVTNLKREIHANAIVGSRFIYDKIFLEPSVWVNYSAPDIFDVSLNVKMEKYEAFWAGLSYSTSHTIALQLGLIVIKGFTKDGALRIGTMASYNIGSFGKFRGVGYEAYVAYRFEL